MPHTVFLSDIHMEAGRPDISAAFADMLTSEAFLSADAAYLLGDVVEYWLGDDTPVTGIEHALDALKTLADHDVPVYIQHGNRDFLLGHDFCNRYGVTLINDPHIIDLYGTPTALMHGDSLCTDDVDYQQFKQMVRNPDWQNGFLSMPLQERIETVQKMRATTTQAVSEKAAEIMDVNEDTVREVFNDLNVTRIIHGHTHRPNVHEYIYNGETHTRIVLSDWHTRAHYLMVTASDFEMRYINFDSQH